MTAWSLRFQRALLLLMSVLLLAGALGHGHAHHHEAVIHAEQQAGNVVEEHCTLCDLLFQPTELMASEGRSVRTITGTDTTTGKTLAVSAGRAGRVSDRGPPSKV